MNDSENPRPGLRVTLSEYHRFAVYGVTGLAAVATLLAILYRSMVAAAAAGWLFRSALSFTRGRECPIPPDIADAIVERLNSEL